MLIGEVLARHARCRPGQPFVVGEKGATTYAEHLERADRLAAALRAMGCRPQDRVAILMENTPECLEVFSACERAGFIAVPVNYRLTPAEHAEILADCEPRAVVFDGAFQEAVADLRQRVPEVREWIGVGAGAGAVAYEDALDVEGGEPVEAPGPGDIAYLIYTSGTTGRPKGVKISQAAAYAMARNLAIEGDVGPTDRFLLAMPLYHIGGKSVQLAHLLRGGSLRPVRRFSAGPVLEAIAADRASTLLLAPTMLRALLGDPAFAPARVASLRRVYYAASPMQEDLLEQAMAVFGPILVQFYGSTEGGAISTVLSADQHVAARAEGPQRLQSAGQPCVDCEVTVTGEDGAELGSPGGVGEVLVRSEAMMDGYWNNDLATHRTLRDGWVRTGDLGYLDGEGYLFLVDRSSDVIVSGGENIHSLEVERALARHPAVGECAVIGVPDEYWGEAVTAFVVVAQGAPAPAESELISHCAELLAGYKKPKQIRFVDALPKLPSGKVNKPELRRPFWGEAVRRVH